MARKSPWVPETDQNAQQALTWSAPYPVQVVVVTVTALLWSFRGPKKVAPLEPSKEAGAILEELTERERQR